MHALFVIAEGGDVFLAWHDVERDPRTAAGPCGAGSMNGGAIRLPYLAHPRRAGDADDGAARKAAQDPVSITWSRRADRPHPPGPG